jgi:hypothetical protein
MDTNNDFTVEQFLAIENPEKRIEYLLIHYDDQELFNAHIREIACEDQCWSSAIVQSNTRFAYALKARLDSHDPEAFKEIFKKFLLTGILGNCLPTLPLIIALNERGEDWLGAYIPARTGMTAKRMALRKPQIKMLLERFGFNAEFKSWIDALCQYLIASKYHGRVVGIPEPHSIIAHWEHQEIRGYKKSQLFSVVSPYLSLEELWKFQLQVDEVHAKAAFAA